MVGEKTSLFVKQVTLFAPRNGSPRMSTHLKVGRCRDRHSPQVLGIKRLSSHRGEIESWSASLMGTSSHGRKCQHTPLCTAS